MLKAFGKDFVIYGISSSVGKFVALFLVPIYTRIFSPEDYGTIDLISTIISISTILGMLQLESAVSRYYYAEKNENARNKMVSTALWSITGVSILFLIVISTFANIISYLLFKSSEYSNVIIVACIAIPLNNISSLFTVVVRFKKKAVHYLLFQIIQVSISVGLTIFLVVYLKAGIIGVFFGQLSGVFVAAAMMAFYLRKEIILYWNRLEFKKMMHYALPLVPAVAGGWLNSYISRFIMIGYLSVYEIGLYAVALKISSVFQLIGTALRMAWGPFLWENYETNPEHKKIFVRIQKEFSLFVLIVVILITFFSKEIMLFFTTELYVESAKLIGLISLSVAINGIIIQLTNIGPAITKRTKFNAIIYFYSLPVNIISLFILVPFFGVIGVPISMLLESFVYIIIGWYNSEKLYYVGFEKAPMLINMGLTIVVIILNILFDFPLYIKFFLTVCLFLFLIKNYKSRLIQFLKKIKTI